MKLTISKNWTHACIRPWMRIPIELTTRAGYSCTSLLIVTD